MLLDLAFGLVHRAEVGHCSCHHHHVGIGGQLGDGGLHLCGCLDLHHGRTRWHRQVDGRHERDPCAPSRCFRCNGVALFAATAVGDDSDGVDGLARATGADHHVHALQRTDAQHALDLGNDALRCGETALAQIATGEAALVGLDDVHPAATQHGQVLGHGRVLPHLGVHRRAHHDRGPGGEQGVGQ